MEDQCIAFQEISCKVNGYTFRGSNSAIFTFVSLLNGGQLLIKESAPFGADSFLREWTHFKSNQKVTKVVPLGKNGRKFVL